MLYFNGILLPNFLIFSINLNENLNFVAIISIYVIILHQIFIGSIENHKLSLLKRLILTGTKGVCVLPKITIKDLLEAGVHFGHQTRRWNPKMARYIFGERNGIYIINLEKSLLCLEDACAFLTDVAQSGKEVLFVGTKKQAQNIVQECAVKSGMPYVVQRWLGGMLTNYETVSKSILRMKEITDMEARGKFDLLTKKEISSLLKERDKMKKNLGGIQEMKSVPGAVIIVDTKKEEIALKEARKLKIPIVAVLDTNADPDEVDFPIPGNDDALRAISVVCTTLAEAIQEGRSEREKITAAAKKAAQAEETKAQSKEKQKGKDKAKAKPKAEEVVAPVESAPLPEGQ